MIVKMPSAAARRQISATGKISAVGEVIWLMTSARPWGDALPQLIDDDIGAGGGQRNRLAAVVRALCLADERPGALDRAIFVRGAQHLVAGLQWKRAGDDIHAVGSVGHEDQVIPRRAEKRPQFATRLSQQIVQPPRQKLDGLLLKGALPALVFRKDGPRTRAEAAVVQK
jgi:hypothetical protein